MNTKKLVLCVACILLLSIALPAAAASAEKQLSYDSPEAAIAALAEATKKNDKAKLLAILGPEANDLIDSGDAVADNAERAAFAAAFDKKHSLVPYTAAEEETPGTAPERRTLEVGENDWPFPIPLVKDGKTGRWSFDGKSGLEELLDRRVGQNELAAMQVCQAYVDAQRDYYRMNPEKGLVPQFAQKIVSTPGKRDGLYWKSKDGEPPSPLGSLAAAASQEGYKSQSQDESAPYHGYRYKVLTAQGENAKGGAYSYVENGMMFGGFALLAYPDNYGVSGVMSFVVNQEGVLYEKNLGQDTSALAQKITLFDPDDTWKEVDADGESTPKN